jgi:predicted MPP superfamily phosphohydrolase
MAAFVLFFVLTYSAMHALVYYHLRRLWAGHTLVPYLVIGFMLGMVLAPLGVRVLETRGFPTLAQGLAYIGYSWMGFVFLSFCGFAALSALGLLQRLAGLWVRFPVVNPGSRCATLAVLIAVALTCGYGALEAWNIRVERIRIETGKLPPDVPRLTIAQISDVHLGLIVRAARLERILEQVRAAAPDLLISTGDLVDGQLDHMSELFELLRDIQPRFGKYAITGNHEFYAGLEEALEFTRRAGFTVLRDEIAGDGAPICVAGVDYRFRGAPDGELPLLKAADCDRFVLFLKHTPVVRPETLGLFDLQLSGHTHRGQIFPFGLVTRIIYPMQAGFHRLDRGSHLYTSRGSGTWGPPMRVGSPPEVTIIELVRVVHEDPAKPVRSNESRLTIPLNKP